MDTGQSQVCTRLYCRDQLLLISDISEILFLLLFKIYLLFWWGQ